MEKTWNKFETHLHNAENSGCASARAKEIPKIYRDASYGGIFVTNHYNRFAFDFMTDGKKTSWRGLMDKYLYGYRTMKEEGEKIGLKVLLGAELSPHRYISPWGGDYPGMEFLIYGFDEKFLYDNPELHLLSQEELFQVVDKNGFLMYQTHPFRAYCLRGNPRYMHGVEAYNLLNQKYGSGANEAAAAFAEEHNLKKIAGSDFHHTATAQNGLSGIYLPESINTPQEFVSYAKKTELKFIL